MGMSIRFELVYGIQLDLERVDPEVLEELESDSYDNPASILELKSCGDCYQNPERILAFRDRGWRGPDLRYELPEGNAVQKLSDRKLPSSSEIEQAKKYFSDHELDWQEPDWFAAVTIT